MLTLGDTRATFKQASWDLCSSIAGIACHISIKNVEPDGLSPLVACCLLPLNECPGVTPVGVGEVFWCITGKAVMIGLLDWMLLVPQDPHKSVLVWMVDVKQLSMQCTKFSAVKKMKESYSLMQQIPSTI